MLKKSNIYWYCQVAGWLVYIAINYLFFGLSSKLGASEYLFYFYMLLAGIAVTHAYRHIIIRFKILEVRVSSQLVYLVFFSILKAAVFFVIYQFLLHLFGLAKGQLTLFVSILAIFNFLPVFFFWNVIYFGFQYFQNYKRTEINSLRYLAASRESELNNLKAQLNPHFIFNCMNSIRALIDENPQKAKDAVSQLSNILRYTLLMDKSKEIVLKDEMALVNDFLTLEKIRYEERLNYEFKISDEVKNCQIPPFIIQSQVENAIKHGISKLPGTGVVVIEAVLVGGGLQIKVSNTGKLNTQQPLTGVGFKNSVHRLQMLYGQAAKISITEEQNTVVVAIFIPLNEIQKITA